MDPAYEDYVSVFRDEFKMADLIPVDVSLAVCVTSRVQGDPLWVYEIGAPSSGKTEIIRPIKAVDPEHAFFLSSLTPNSLVSGYDRSGATDILPQLNGKTLAIKDFTTILEMGRESRDVVFAQLRDCYDGSYARGVGTRGRVEYESHFNLIAAATSAIEEYYVAQSILGQRFLICRVPTVKFFLSDAEREIIRIRKSLLTKFKPIMERASSPGQVMPALPPERLAKLKELASMVALMRTHVRREAGSHDILSVPETEAPPRLTNQLIKLAQGVAYVHGDDVVGDKAMSVVNRVIKDTVPSLRTMVIAALKAGYVTIDAMADAVRVNPRTIDRKLEELLVLGVVDVDRTGKPHIYKENQDIEFIEPMSNVRTLTSEGIPSMDMTPSHKGTNVSQYERIKMYTDKAVGLISENGSFGETDLFNAMRQELLNIQPSDVYGQISNWRKGGDIIEVSFGRYRFV